MKVFLFGWLSLFLFWGAAFYFCFIGSEVGFKHWKRKLVIGTPFFLLFYFLVHAYGVPRYFVYDQVTPKTLDGEVYYPAVKNHLIFQGASYKDYGIISKDLSTFKANEEYFSAFDVQPLKEYPSVKGLTRWFNELLLVGFFLLWWLFLNKFHNASAASELYKLARKGSRLEHYQSYLNASYSIRFFQPLKRRIAKRDMGKIREVYLQALQRVLLQLMTKAHDNNRPLLTYLHQQLGISPEAFPSVMVKATVDDHSTTEAAEQIEKPADIKRNFYMPTNEKLSSALTARVVETLNQFIPEKLLRSGEGEISSPTAALSCELNSALYNLATFNSGRSVSLVKIYSNQNIAPNSQRLHLGGTAFGFPSKLYPDSKDKSQSYCVNLLAQNVVNNVFFTNLKQVGETTDQAKAVLKQKQEALQKLQQSLFDTMIKECKSTVKDAALAEGVSQVIERNQAMFDSVVAETHQLIADHAELFADLIAEEVAAGLLESFAEAASE